jgi:hypothetical protein
VESIGQFPKPLQVQGLQSVPGFYVRHILPKLTHERPFCPFFALQRVNAPDLMTSHQHLERASLDAHEEKKA